MLGLLGDVGTHMGSIGKQVITSSLPDWHWCQAQLVSRSHYYVIMLSDVGTRMGSIGKLVHDIITMPLSRLVPAHAHRWPVELVSFAITGVLIVGINDDNNFL